VLPVSCSRARDEIGFSDVDPNVSLFDEADVVAEWVAQALADVVEQNDSQLGDDNEATVYHAEFDPEIPVHFYIERLVEFADLRPACAIAGLIILDRILDAQPRLLLNSLTVHRLSLACFFVATKVFDDHARSIRRWSAAGGVTQDELCGMEMDVLRCLDFRLHVWTGEYEAYRDALAAINAPVVPASPHELLSSESPAPCPVADVACLTSDALPPKSYQPPPKPLPPETPKEPKVSLDIISVVCALFVTMFWAWMWMLRFAAKFGMELLVLGSETLHAPDKKHKLNNVLHGWDWLTGITRAVRVAAGVLALQHSVAHTEPQKPMHIHIA